MLDGERRRGHHLLDGTAVAAKAGAKRAVPGDDRVHCPAEGAGVQGPAQAFGDEDVERRVGGVEPLEEPHPFLARRQRELVDRRRGVLRAPGAFRDGRPVGEPSCEQGPADGRQGDAVAGVLGSRCCGHGEPVFRSPVPRRWRRLRSADMRLYRVGGAARGKSTYRGTDQWTVRYEGEIRIVNSTPPGTSDARSHWIKGSPPKRP